MYYRIATQVDSSPTWQWKSTGLSSLDTLLQVLRLYRFLPQDRLWVFSSSECVGLEEQLKQENEGLGSNVVLAAQFLRKRLIRPPEVSERERRVCQEMASMGIATQSLVNESCTGAHALDMPGRIVQS